MDKELHNELSAIREDIRETNTYLKVMCKQLTKHETEIEKNKKWRWIQTGGAGVVATIVSAVGLLVGRTHGG